MNRRQGAGSADEDPAGRRWLTRGVLSVGTASLGSDAGHEMTTSLLPSFLTSTLHAGPAALGAIEGVSDALVGLSKLAGGPLSSDPRRRGRLASGGYVVTALATAAIGLTTAVWQVAMLRALAWMSRGLRSPARDSLLMSLVPGLLAAVAITTAAREARRADVTAGGLRLRGLLDARLGSARHPQP